jgi:hypothetical protein
MRTKQQEVKPYIKYVKMKTTINKIKGTAMMLAAMMMTVVATFSACSTEELTADGGNSAQKALFTVGDFPAYSTDATTRTIGTADAGKTAWAAGDVILVKAEQYSGYDATSSAVSGTVSKTTLYKMTCTAAASESTAATWTTEQYIGSEWTTPTGLTAGSYEEGLKITAYYAPNYEFNASNELALSSGKTAGTSEKLSVEQQMQFVKLSNAASITIDFSGATRNYSRLRIASSPNTTIAFTCAGFTPVGTANAGVSAVSLTTDAKGNAYMYGSWPAKSAMSVTTKVNESDDCELVPITSKASASYTDGTNTGAATDASTADKSYALSAPATYNLIGAGTSASPYLIYNAAQLQDIKNAPSTGELINPICAGEYINLENDIDCNTISSFTPIGTQSSPFSGTFEGNGHTISNLKLGETSDHFSGLFGYVSNTPTTTNAIIQNLVLSNPTTSNALYVGALVGYLYSGNILNCGVTVTDDAHSIATTNNKSYEICVGGLVGELYAGNIVACYANIPVSTSGYSTYAGGLVGYIAESKAAVVYASYATGSVTGEASHTIGGLVGYIDNSGTVSGCYASGTVSASSSTSVGGLVGNNFYGTISYCATTSTTGTAAKGGTNGTDYTGIGANDATVTGCYGNISDYANIYNYITPEAAKTAWLTARTKLPATYAGYNMTLDALWNSKTATSSSLKLYWEK